MIDELLKRRDLRTISSGEIRWLLAEVVRLRGLNLQFAEQVTCEAEATRMARQARNEATEMAEELRCELRLCRQQMADELREATSGPAAEGTNE